jgi:hypothetical protein
MALDRYVCGLDSEDEPYSASELNTMRRVATRHSAPPVWVKDWRQFHESHRIIEETEAAPAAHGRPMRRASRRRSPVA